MVQQHQRRSTDKPGPGNGGGGEASQKPQLVVGQLVHVWKPTGVRKLKYGVQTSERTGGDFPDIQPSEDLEIIEKLSSNRAVVKRNNGQKVIVHKNHIDQSSKYYAARKRQQQLAESQERQQQSSTGLGHEFLSPQDRIHAAREAMERARLEYDEAMKEVEAIAEEISQDLPVVIDDEDTHEEGERRRAG